MRHLPQRMSSLAREESSESSCRRATESPLSIADFTSMLTSFRTRLMKLFSLEGLSQCSSRFVNHSNHRAPAMQSLWRTLIPVRYLVHTSTVVRAQPLHQSRLRQRPTIDRFEAGLHPEMREQFTRGDNSPMRDFETWLPWQQLNLCSPYGADQDAVFLRTTEAYASAESEEPPVAPNGTRLLQDLPAES